MKEKRNRRERILAGVLYALPVVFFIVAYFLITVSGEDVLQGAGNWRNGAAIDVAGDAANAFSNNGRITDMYAWSVVDFYDYQFQFGVDVIFRIFDVVMASGIFYLMTWIVRGNRPKLNLRDGLIFDAMFAMLIITQHGRVVYAGFSAIHNYMIQMFILVAFLFPYVMHIRGKMKNMEKWWMYVVMAIGGIIFGMSAALAPIAFVMVMVGYIIYKRKMSPVWAICGVIGVIMGLCVTNFLGPSIGNYAANEVYTETYDYISVAGIFNDLPTGIVKILKHIVWNFGRVVLPLAVYLVVCVIAVKGRVKKVWKGTNDSVQKVVILGVIFMTILILGASQLSAPIRILLPAYLVGIALIMMIFGEVIKTRVLGGAIVVATAVVVVLKIGLAVEYNVRTGAVLSEIKNAESSEVCIDRERVKAINLPVVYLGQEDLLIDWAMPETIYGKTVRFCDVL